MVSGITIFYRKLISIAKFLNRVNPRGGFTKYRDYPSVVSPLTLTLQLRGEELKVRGENEIGT